jgi:uncharacterized membrane protein
MMPLLADGEIGPPLLRFLGRLHPATVHFPIALLSVAALVELWRMARRQELAASTVICLGLGAAGAAVAAVLGWFLEEFDGGHAGELVEWHKYLGLTATALVLVAALLLVRARRSPRALLLLRVLLLAGAGLVGLTGYLGGELVFGRDHLWRGLFTASASGPAEVESVDFSRDVLPVFKEHCWRCHHAGEVVRGKFDLSTRSTAFTSGRNGHCIVPGQPGKSLLYTLLIEPDLDRRMPPAKQQPLTAEQIRIIRQWIEEGADWPE